MELCFDDVEYVFKMIWYDDGDGDIYEEDEELIIEDIDDYKKAVEIFSDSAFESDDLDEHSAYEWIVGGMYLTGSY